MNNTNYMLFAMPNSVELGKKISNKVNLPLTGIERTEFADGEILVSSKETVRNKDVYIVASTCKPVNDNIMELLLFIDSLKRASAKSIRVIMTYYGYARQDRKAAGRQPISSKLVADLLETAGVNKMIIVDLHNPSLQGFFDIPVDDLRGMYAFASGVKKLGSKFTIVSPDHGGASRARRLSEMLNGTSDIAIINKRRTSPNQSETLGILGDVTNKNVIIVDDIIDTGGTILKGAKAAKEAGAKKIVIAATHGLFSNGFEAFDNADYIDHVIVTDSVSHVSKITSKKLEVISLDEFISSVISASGKSQSISAIYHKIENEIVK